MIYEIRLFIQILRLNVSRTFFMANIELTTARPPSSGTMFDLFQFCVVAAHTILELTFHVGTKSYSV